MIVRIKFVNSTAKDLLISINSSFTEECKENSEEVDSLDGLLNSSDNDNNSTETSDFGLSCKSLVLQLKSKLQRWAAAKWKRGIPHVRLIGAGRLISSQEIIGDFFKSVPSPYVTLHCLFDFESDAADSSRARQTASQTHPPLVGFDRLLEMGLSREEVQELRQQFHAIRSIDNGFTADSNSLTANPTPTLNIIQGSSAVNNSPLHDEEVFWREVLPSPSNFLDAESFLTGDLEFLAGLCIGFFFGLIAGFFIREEEVFSKSSQKGIGLGLILNLAFGGLTSMFYSNSYKAVELGFTSG